jgi:mannan endo-1,4-beta-mannosidase
MRRPPRTWSTVAATACIVVAAAAIAMASIKYHDRIAAAEQAGGSTPTVSTPPVAVPRFVYASLPSAGFRYLGVYEGSSTAPGQYAQVERFAQAVGRQPNIVMSYSSWGEPFSVSFAETAREHGATLLIDLDPTNTSCASIAAGQQDAFLESYAQSVKVFGHPVIISFGHEMNGTWYPWGWTQTQPAVFVRAWRHVVDVFRQAGADNVTWLWTINSVASYEGPIADYWPGASYVTWVAFDAYYYSPDDDFSGVFGPSITALRQLTTKPILIAETAVGQLAGQASKIPGLFAGVRRAGLLGFVWYDQAQSDGPFHQDWQLEGDSYAVAAFRAAAAAYLVPRPAVVHRLQVERCVAGGGVTPKACAVSGG